MTNYKKQLSNSLPISSSRFGIIQLSDLQFGKKHRFGYPSEIAEKLLIDINKMSREHDFTPIYIVLSGDIAETANPEEFKDAANVIQEILNGLNIEKTDILCVPGNHDVNRDLSKQSQKTGDDQLKFKPYNGFLVNIGQDDQGTTGVTYPLIKDNQLIKDDQFIIEFILLNSCEKIDQENNSAWICKRKLNKSLASKKEKGTLRIVISHHLVHALAEGEIKEATKTNGPVIPKQSLQKRVDAINNMKEIKSIIENHKCDIVLTGHMHEPHLEPSKNNEGHSIIYCGCGSTGVNAKHREDGVQNQYCIHVIDLEKNEFESIWRAYNPSTQTEYGIGGWTEDNTFVKNPTEFFLPVRKPIPAAGTQVTSESSVSPKIKPSAPAATNLDYMKLAIANLLGGWDENA